MLKKNANPLLTLTDKSGKKADMYYAALLEGTTKTGVIPEVDRLLWRNTHRWGTLSIASEDFPAITAQSGPNITSLLETPGLVTTDAGVEILGDVLYFRAQATQDSLYIDNFRPCFRAYRQYLTACITSVDAWLNEHAWYALNDPIQSSQFSDGERNSLQNRRKSINNKLREWPSIIFRSAPLEEGAISWMHFQDIREARNAFVHVNEPRFNFSLRPELPEFSIFVSRA